jgi:hypothetical protein
VRDRSAARVHDDETRVLVVPVTHNRPENSDHGVELPPAVKRHLGLDTERSWAILTESNLFDWPGPDLRRVGDQGDGSIAYGFLPPRLFAELRRRFVALEKEARSRRVRRTD